MNEEIEKLRAALWSCATQAVALKKPCSDPDSPQAFMNARYQEISNTAHIALGTIRGPSAKRMIVMRTVRELYEHLKKAVERSEEPEWCVLSLSAEDAADLLPALREAAKIEEESAD